MNMTSLVLGASLLGRNAASSFHTEKDGPFLAFHPDWSNITGPDASLELIASSEVSAGGDGVSLFHEAGVWARSNDGGGSIYITSNIIKDENEDLAIKVCRLRVSSGSALVNTGLRASSSSSSVYVVEGVEYEDLPGLAEDVIMANGATAHGQDILFCSQGQHQKFPKSRQQSLAQSGQDRIPGSLMLVRPKNNGSFEVRPLVNNFRGREFNALNDVAVHTQSSSIFFTDPDYGLKQGFKGPSQLPNGVWRYSTKSGALSMVADGLKKPNGVVCSPDGKTCYVTDTDFIHGDGSTDPTRVGTIYAYDVVGKEAPQLHNKRVFALVDCGAPDGIKVDELGNVYTGTFEGVDVYNPAGILLGKILLPRDSRGEQRGAANLVFGPKGVLFILSETTVWAAKIAQSGELEGVEPAETNGHHSNGHQNGHTNGHAA